MKLLIFLSLGLLSYSSFATEITVFGAASLTNVLTEIGKNFEKQQGGKIKFSFDSSSRLARQIHEGAKADLFFSADKIWNTYLENKKIVLSSNTKDLLSNELVLISHHTNNTPLVDLKSLLRISFKTLSLANETVPAGKYAYESLKKSDVLIQMQGKIVNGDNVRNVLAWVARNEADFGIVFLTDAKVEPKVKIKVIILSNYHSAVIYPVSLVGSTPSSQASAFYDYLQSKEAQQVFERHGFKWK